MSRRTPKAGFPWSLEPNYGERPLIEPRRVVENMARRLKLRIEELRAPVRVLLSLSVGATGILVEETRAEEAPWIYRARPLYVGDAAGEEVGIIWAAPGAPLTAMVMEDLIALGTRTLIGLGLAAATQPNIEVGDLILPTSAMRLEGTSHHYLPPEVEAAPTGRVAEALREACEEVGARYHIGPICSTDAPYRETRSMIEQLLRGGVLGIDMETSALFSIGQYRGVETGCLLVASTNLIKDDGDPGFYHERLGDSMRRAARSCLRALEGLSISP